MAPKAAPKKAAAGVSHASYQDMIKLAIINLKDRKGSSRQAIKKYIQSNNNLGNTSDAAFNSHVNRALASGQAQGVFDRPKGPSGPVKLQKPAAKVDGDAPKTAPKTAATKKATTGEKKAAPKKAATGEKKAAPKKTSAAAKPKANTKKTAAPKAASAEAEKAAPVTSKTKSGRVTKTSAKPAEKKKAAPKKTVKAVKKAPTPKKAAATTT